MYEIRDASFNLIDHADEIVAACGRDAVSIAKAYRGDCIIVRVADAMPMMAYGNKPGRLLCRWRNEMLPGVARAAA